MERKNAWKTYAVAEHDSVFALADRYRAFLNAGKTERECVQQAIAMAEQRGYRDLNRVIASGEKVKSEAAGFHDIAIFKQGVTL